MTEAETDKVILDIVSDFVNAEFECIPEQIQFGLTTGVEPRRLLDDGLILGIREVGEQFRRGEVYLPEMLLAARALQSGMDLIEPLLGDRTAMPAKGKVVIGTVKGDIHSLGKNIVIVLLKIAGFEVFDLGVDVPASAFISEAVKRQARIICISALMTTTLYQQREVIEHLCASGRREDFFVMVGGASTNPNWAIEIKADGYGATAADAVTLAEAYMGQVKKENNHAQ